MSQFSLNICGKNLHTEKIKLVEDKEEKLYENVKHETLQLFE